MRCIDDVRPLFRWGAVMLALALTGCAGGPAPQAAPVVPIEPIVPIAPAVAAAPTAGPAVALRFRADPVGAYAVQPGDAASGAQATAPASARTQALPRYVQLGPPKTPQSWDELRLQAAQRFVAAHPDTSYVGMPPAVLLAIPILEVELHADGSVRHIKVLRVPGQAQDTTQLAIEAVRRAAPFGDVSRLSRPWKFVETFLFDDERRFMPRMLDR